MSDTEPAIVANMPTNQATNDAAKREDGIVKLLRILEKEYTLSFRQLTFHTATLIMLLYTTSELWQVSLILNSGRFQITENFNAMKPEGVCYEYCNSFTLSYPPSTCNCIGNATDISECDNKTLTTPARQELPVSLICQTRPMDDIILRNVLYYVCYVDVCENNFDEGQASCRSCPHGSACSAPVPATTLIYSTMVACVKEHLANVCKTIN